MERDRAMILDTRGRRSPPPPRHWIAVPGAGGDRRVRPANLLLARSAHVEHVGDESPAPLERKMTDLALPSALSERLDPEQLRQCQSEQSPTRPPCASAGARAARVKAGAGQRIRAVAQDGLIAHRDGREGWNSTQE